MAARTLEAETLDHLAPDDPAAIRARRDLRRVNRVMGAQGVLERALARVGPAVGGAGPVRVLELGCGDGLLLLDLARAGRLDWRDVRLTLLDRQPLIGAATLAGYAAAGWQARALIADVLDWARGPDPDAPWNVIVANLFLHHFEGDELAALFAACARRTGALVACEPRRSAFALAASHLVGLIGANAVTRRDAVLSVRAGFKGGELSAAWSAEPADAWRLEEYDDGLFSHSFCAVRREPASNRRVLLPEPTP